MRFLICGLGSIGRRHLGNLRQLGETDVVLLRTGKSTLPDQDLADLPVERDISHALHRWHPHAALITNPTALHMEVAIPAAEAGCHLFLEKPISHNMGGVARLQEIVTAGGLRALVGFQFRYHPSLRTVKKWLERGAIGRPIRAQAHWGEFLPGWHPWEDYRRSYSARAKLGGGALLTLSHPFDYLRWFMGEVEGVCGKTARLSDLELDVEDTADALLTFREGPIGHVHVDYNQRPPRHWLEITGTEGTIRWDQDSGSAQLWTASAGEWETFQLPTGYDRDRMFLDEMRHFLQVMEGKAEPMCTLEDGVKALEIVLAASRSVEEGREVRLRSDATKRSAERDEG
jgi:predicted dehydrogenase